MSLKAELETWTQALEAFDATDLPRALDIFTTIAESSKVRFNIGLIHATQGHHTQAIKAFKQATQLDRFFAVAYFQRGVSMFLTGEWDRAKMQFEMALSNMRGNDKIDYTQLGLPFNLFLPEIHFNLALCHIKQKDLTKGMYELRKASTRKMTAAHEVIEEAIEKRGEGFTVFSIPVGVVFRPSENKLKNLAPKDYKGKAKLIAVSSTDDEYTTFTGVTRLGRKQTPSGSPMDAHQISRSKTLMRMGHRPDDADGEQKTIKSFSTRDLGETQEVLGPEADDKSKAVKELGDLMDRRFSPSSSIGSGSKENLLSPLGGSQPVPVAPENAAKSKGGMFMRRSNTLRDYIRSPSFLSKSSGGSSGTEDASKSKEKDKDKKYAPPIVTRGLDSLSRGSAGQDMGRSVSEPSFAKPAELGPRTAPADGYRGQLQYGGPFIGGATNDGRFAAPEPYKQLSPLRPKRPEGRYNTSAEVYTRANANAPMPIQRSASAVPTLTDVREPPASFRSAPVSGQHGHGRIPTVAGRDDSSANSQATGVTGKYPKGAVTPAFVFEEDVTKEATGKTRARAEVRMTELYDGYYGSPDSNHDEDEASSVPIPPVPVFNARFKQDESERPLMKQTDRANPSVLMQNLEKLRIQRQEKSDSTFSRSSPESGSQYSPVVTVPQSPYEHGGISLTKKPTLLTPATGSINEFRRQPTFRRSPLNSSNFEDGELIDMEMQSIRVKIRYNDDIRAVVISSQVNLYEFRNLLCDKFEIPDVFKLRFRDEEGDQVSLKDDGDWDAALDYARVTAAGRPEGRLDVWLF